MMSNRMNYKSNTSFIDMFMLLSLILGIMVIVLFMLIKPIIPQKEDVPLDEQVLVKLEWDDTVNYDLDMWLFAPDNTIVGFKSKSKNGITLERDDLGHKNEYGYVDGVMAPIYDNTEVVRIKEVMDGDYYISVHFYSAMQSYTVQESEEGKSVKSKFVITVYFAGKHVPVSITHSEVHVRQEVGVVKLTFKNGKLVGSTQSTRLIGTTEMRTSPSNGSSGAHYGYQ